MTTQAERAERMHTPGPWMMAAKPSSVVGWPVVARPSGRSIASVTHFGLGAGFENHQRESEANAHLIAAAPDLLKAAKELLEMGELFIPTKIDAPGFKRARAAIARAEGRDNG